MPPSGTQDGTEYVDCFAGISVVNAGHRHPKVIAAAKAQMDEFVHAATYVYHVPVVGTLGERLAEISPGRLQKTFFGNSGAEGIETAMRLAKAYTGKHEFITLTHSFHGRTAGTLSITGNKARKTRGGPYLPGVAFAPAPYVYRNPFGTDDPEEVAERCAAMVEWAIDYQSSGDVAAFIAEPVMGEGGILVPPGELLPAGQRDPRPPRHPLHRRRGAVRLRAHRQDVRHRALRRRAGHHGAGQGHRRRLPLSATIAPAEIADSLKPGEHLSTFGGNPVSCAAALANIEVMQEERLPEESARKGEHAMARLRELAERHPLIGEVRGLGLMIGVELVSDRTTKEPAAKEAAAVRRLAREAGVLIGVGGQGGNVVRIQPPLVIEDAALDRALDVVDDALGVVSREA